MLFFNNDIGGGFANANGGQSDRRSAFLSHFVGGGQCRDRVTDTDYCNIEQAAADMYDNYGVRDVSEAKRRLGF